MFPLFEVVCVKNGVIMNSELHESRYETSLKELYGISRFENLLKDISIPKSYEKGLFKMKIVYNGKQKRVVFENYHVQDIKTLKVVEDNLINYRLKYTNRDHINSLYNQKEHCDDILIIKDGKVTDSSYTNIVFHDGDLWITPKTFLLNGTMRQYLLQEGIIIERYINKEDIINFKSFKLINAMRDFKAIEQTPIANIKF